MRGSDIASNRGALVEGTVPGMAVAAIPGGYLGARVARRLPRNVVRWVVIAIGFGLAGYYFYKQVVGPTLTPPGEP